MDLHQREFQWFFGTQKNFAMLPIILVLIGLAVFMEPYLVFIKIFFFNNLKVAGSRSGAPVAGAWYAMMHIGRE